MTNNVKGFCNMQNSENGIGKTEVKKIKKENKSAKLSSFLNLLKEAFRRLGVDSSVLILQGEIMLAWPFRALTLSTLFGKL